MNWERFREASFSTSNKIFTRYEDLVADRQSVISKICEVIGVSSKLKGEEKVRKSKSSKKSKSFGYKFSPSVICLSKSMGYSQSDLKHTDSFKWTWYELYIKYLYSPAKSFYRLVKK